MVTSGPLFETILIQAEEESKSQKSIKVFTK
jgi:hypothetical protein